jgi:hypothetical protein
MRIPTFLKAGSAALAVAGGVLAAVFVVIPAASASGQPANDQQSLSHVHNLDSTEVGDHQCDFLARDRDNNGENDDWKADCYVYSGHVQAVTFCQTPGGHDVPPFYDRVVGRGSWHFEGHCGYNDDYGQYNKLVHYDVVEALDWN